MCFVRRWKSGFSANVMTPFLSTQMVEVLVLTSSSSWSNLLNQIASLPASLRRSSYAPSMEVLCRRFVRLASPFCEGILGDDYSHWILIYVHPSKLLTRLETRCISASGYSYAVMLMTLRIYELSPSSKPRLRRMQRAFPKVAVYSLGQLCAKKNKH